MPQQKGLVISNCQVQPLKHYLSLMSENLIFDGFGVHMISPASHKAEVEKLVEKIGSGEYRTVVCVHLSDDYEQLSATKIKSALQNVEVAIISSMFFSGLHPDLTYIGGLSRRLNGPLTDYHSKIALMCWLRGFKLDDAIACFNHHNYHKLGYYAEADASLSEMTRRDGLVDVPFAPIIKQTLHKIPSFMSVNHPAPTTILQYAEKIMDRLVDRGVTRHSGWRGSGELVPNFLAHAPVYPVFPEIASMLRLPYSGTYSFKPQSIGDLPVNPLDLKKFVELEYAAFNEVGMADLQSSHQARQFQHRHQNVEFSIS